MLRHGPTEWNALGRIQGHTDIPLSDEGLAKMRGCCACRFAAARVFVSPLLRARQTAEALGLRDADPGCAADGTELGQLGRPDPRRDSGARRRDAFQRAGLRARLPAAAAANPPRELHARVAAFLKDVAREDGDAIAVAHLGVLRAAYTLATGWDMATPMPPDLDVSKILMLELARGRHARHCTP